MTICTAKKALGLVLAMAFPASSMLAAANPAMMITSGQVAVNGSNLTRSSALFPGDNVRTTDRSGVTISAPGSTVIVPPNSAVVYEGQAVIVGNGAVEISTTKGMAAKVDSLTIMPASKGSAKFGVTRADGTITIAALHGSVIVSDGSERTVVAQGETQTKTEEQAPAAPEKKKKKKKGGVVPVAVGSQGAGGVSKVILAGAVVGTGTTIAILTTGSPSPESPSNVSK